MKNKKHSDTKNKISLNQLPKATALKKLTAEALCILRPRWNVGAKKNCPLRLGLKGDVKCQLIS